MDDRDRSLLNLLRENSRASTTTLARTLGLSRSTVQDRMKRLEDRGVIAGYTIRYNEEYNQRQISAQVMMTIQPKYAASILQSLKKMSSVVSILTVSGIYDLITTVSAETTEELDETIDKIGLLTGMERTTTSIILSRKYQV